VAQDGRILLADLQVLPERAGPMRILKAAAVEARLDERDEGIDPSRSGACLAGVAPGLTRREALFIHRHWLAPSRFLECGWGSAPPGDHTRSLSPAAKRRPSCGGRCSQTPPLP